jgi:hypothetical protein
MSSTTPTITVIHSVTLLPGNPIQSIARKIATTPTTVPRTQALQEPVPIVTIPKTNGTKMSSIPSTRGAQSCQRFHVFIVFISKTSFVMIAVLQHLFTSDQQYPLTQHSVTNLMHVFTVFVLNDRFVDFHLTLIG